jgi:hypothetical protein
MSQSKQRVAVGLYLLMLLAGCYDDAEKLPKGQETSSLTSPDGLSWAFVWMPEQSGALGATTSIVYQVWIQYLRGNHAPELLLKADKTDGFKTTWKSPTELEICYGPTQIFLFRNFSVYAEQSSSNL